MKRKLDDSAKEPNKSRRYSTRATTQAVAGAGNDAPAADQKNSSNQEEATTLQSALDLLGAYRAVVQELREAVAPHYGPERDHPHSARGDPGVERRSRRTARFDP
ncbi:hypothetical protein VFPBJ_11523 [Purpureocillium lilacinum]|uniref:Uncharacterized protein n=1 Tax=Purpureocillium lilacinum TaxID=33203 RepID=A0A179F6N8_PURLI|nr:hypothetical protein VFPBJ_11523 [Purpureocillium lilacinum]